MDTLPPYAIYTVLAVIATALIVRVAGGIGRPREKDFTCARCGKIAPHSARTIQVWRNGSSAFYCSSCYGKWARQKEEARHE